jgi:hypothetical protein
MDYRIFQICFEKEQITDVDTLLIPFDNTSNERPELREFHSFDRIYKEGHAKDLDAWGVFGPRWNQKLKYSAEDIHNTIQNNPGHDVYIFNFARIICAYHYNVWEQGEPHHKGIVPVSRHVLQSIVGHDRAIDTVMYDDTMCYSSYFVATKKFWNEYMSFLYKVKDVLDNLPPKLDEVYKSSAKYGRDMSLNLFPFIIERMFSTYLTMNDKWKVYHKPYDYSVYELPKGYDRLIGALNGVKRKETLDQWLTLREYFFARYAQFLDLE